jgi:hypothetical protein
MGEEAQKRAANIPGPAIDIGGGVEVNPFVIPGPEPLEPEGSGVDVVIPFDAPKPEEAKACIDSLPPRPHRSGAGHRVYGVVTERARATKAAPKYDEALGSLLTSYQPTILPNPLDPFDHSEMTMEEAIAAIQHEMASPLTPEEAAKEGKVVKEGIPPSPELADAIEKYIDQHEKLDQAKQAAEEAERERKLVDAQRRQQAYLDADQAGYGAIIDLDQPMQLDKGGFPIPTGQPTVIDLTPPVRGAKGDSKPLIPKRKGFITNIRSFEYTPTSGPKIFGKVKSGNMKKVIK